MVLLFLVQVLPATAFADLSVPIRIPIAEWRKAMRQEMGVAYLCKKATAPDAQTPAPRRAGPIAGPRHMLVSFNKTASRPPGGFLRPGNRVGQSRSLHDRPCRT